MLRSSMIKKSSHKWWLRKVLYSTSRIYTTNTEQFISKKPRYWTKWIRIGIFSASFGLGWFTTRHITLSDIMIWWLYETLPDEDIRIANYKAQLENKATHLPVVQQILSNGFIQVFPDRKSSNTLIDNTLNIPGAISISPHFYYNPTTKQTVGVYHLGMKLTGYPFLIHGGILATVMGDLMREAAKFIKGAHTETTDDINISYKFPTLANQFVIVKTTKIEEFGKYIKLDAEIMNQSGNTILVKGKGTFSL